MSIQTKFAVNPDDSTEDLDALATSHDTQEELKRTWKKQLRSFLGQTPPFSRPMKKAASCPGSFDCLLDDIADSNLYRSPTHESVQSELAYPCKEINKELSESLDCMPYEEKIPMILKVVLKDGMVTMLFAKEKDRNNAWLTRFPMEQGKHDRRNVTSLLYSLAEKERERLLIYEFPVEKSENLLILKTVGCFPRHVIIHIDDDDFAFMSALTILIYRVTSIEFTQFPNDRVGMIVAGMAKHAKQFVFNLPVSVDLLRGCLCQNSSVTCIKFKHGCLSDENGDKLLEVVAELKRELEEIHFRESYLTGAGVLNFVKKAVEYTTNLCTVFVEIIIRSREETRKIRNVAYMKREKKRTTSDEVIFRFIQPDQDEFDEHTLGENNGRFKVEIYYAKNLPMKIPQ